MKPKFKEGDRVKILEKRSEIKIGCVTSILHKNIKHIEYVYKVQLAPNDYFWMFENEIQLLMEPMDVFQDMLKQ